MTTKEQIIDDWLVRYTRWHYDDKFWYGKPKRCLDYGSSRSGES